MVGKLTLCRNCALLGLAAVLFLPLCARGADPLPAGVATALEHRKLPPDSLSLYVENLATGEPVLRWKDDEPRNPASVMKVLTTLAALDSLGPDYTWKTEVYLRGDVHEETLDGDLLLKGYGDPYLVEERLWRIVRAVRRAGIRRISGDLLLDDSYFDVRDYDPGAFDGEPLRAYNVAPNALMVNFKAVRYIFEPDAASSSVSLSLLPELENLQVVNQLALKDGYCRGYQRGITITSNEDVDQMIFSGSFPSGCRTYSLYRTALSHNEFAYGMFKAMWRELGGELTGGWKNAALDGDEEAFMTFDSLPLREIIVNVNKYSNNVMARQLLLTLAAEKYGPPGVVENGRKAVRDWLDERGLHVDGLKLDNGAGLSRTSRITAREVAMLLRYAFESPFMPEFMSSLSLSGLDGTLSRRFRNDPLTGMAHIKTGSLDDVTSIAGYLQSRSGERYIVVSLQNYRGVHRGTGEEVQEALLRWLYAM
ncbi:MAG TPA: D-alanyl-D-alanine carboxypeptidase/D-alanyl-D-alanine-endopeptidase [Woeseiaceae bacterium]|nr:D-alanyl-D-alanine carboxypeptidase/D-alanyl-D-alanine-endopeptidase [Woeseiaceae bacterium]